VKGGNVIKRALERARKRAEFNLEVAEMFLEVNPGSNQTLLGAFAELRIALLRLWLAIIGAFEEALDKSERLCK